MMEKQISERIARYRKMAGLTQSQAAQALNIKRSTYAHMERQGNPRLDMVARLAELFHVTSEQILHGEAAHTDPQPAGAFLGPPVEAAPSTLRETSVIDIVDKPPFVPTAKEMNIIKIYRCLSQERKAEVVKYIEDVYQASKKGEK